MAMVADRVNTLGAEFEGSAASLVGAPAATKAKAKPKPKAKAKEAGTQNLFGPCKKAQKELLNWETNYC